MSVLFHLRRGRAVLGATAVLLTLVLASTAAAIPARDQAAGTDAAPALVAAKAQEQYYTSHGDPKPISTVQTGTPASDFDWPSAGIGAGIAMAIGLLGFTAFALTHRRPGRGVLFS